MALTETTRRYIAYAIYTLVFVAVIVLIPANDILDQSVINGRVDWPQIVAFMLILAFPQLILRRFTGLMLLVCFVLGFMLTAFSFMAHQFLTAATVSYYFEGFNAVQKATWGAVYAWQLLGIEVVIRIIRRRRWR